MATAEQLTCIICSEVFTNPATLQCDHTFCRPCLLKYTKTQPQAIQAKSIPCPVCRQMTKVISFDSPVEEWINEVKPSHLIQGLVDDFGLVTNYEGTRTCQWCKNGGDTIQATSWCSDCEELLCDNCLKLHRRISVLRDHQTAHLSDDFKPQKKRPFVCTEHTDERVKLFCKDCKKAVCHTCCSIKHRQCIQVVTIDTIMPDVTTVLVRNGDNLRKKIEETQLKISDQNNDIEAILKRAKITELEIDEATQKVIDKIKESGTKLLNNLSQLKGHHVAVIKADVKSNEITVQMYQQKLEFIDQAIKSKCLKDMFAMYESCEDSADDKHPSCNQENRPAVGRILFAQDVEKMNKAIEDIQLGKFEIVKDVSDLESSAVLHCSIDCKTELDKKDPNLYDVLVLTVPGGKTTVVADHDNNTIKAFYHLNSTWFQKSLELHDNPWQLAHIKDDYIAISFYLKTQIVIVKFDASPVVTSTIETEKYYYGLASLSSSNLLGGKCAETNSLDIFDLSGQVVKSITTDVCTNPDYLHVTRKNNLLVSEESARSLVSVTTEGEPVFTYSPTGYRALKRPWGITTTSTGHILLTDAGLMKVIQLDEFGTYVRDVIVDGLDYPRGLCLDDDGLLYVTSRRFVKVFKFM